LGVGFVFKLDKGKTRWVECHPGTRQLAIFAKLNFKIFLLDVFQDAANVDSMAGGHGSTTTITTGISLV
jgi:hypothetical protein